jgi:hypothetical protein
VKIERTAQRHCLGCRKGAGGGGTPSKSESTRDVEVDEEEEGEIIFPHSPLPENLPSPGDLFGQQMGPPLLPTRQNAPRWMPTGCPACCRNLALHWYVLSYWERMLALLAHRRCTYQVPCRFLCLRRSLGPLCLRLWGHPHRTMGVWSLCPRGPILVPASSILDPMF